MPKTKENRDSDASPVHQSEYRVVMCQTDDDVERLGELSKRGWQVHLALSPSKVLLRRGVGWRD